MPIPPKIPFIPKALPLFFEELTTHGIPTGWYIEHDKPNTESPKKRPAIEELSPHKIDAKPIPKNIITIIIERLHLSLNHPKGIAPKPINKAPNDHNLINSL